MRYCLEHSSPTAMIVATVINTNITVISGDPWSVDNDLEARLVFMKIKTVIFSVLVRVQI